MANNNHDVNNILQACLEAIHKGEETVASVLTRYPEFADELRPQLEAANWLIKSRETFNPRPEFVSASRQRLMEQINQGVIAPAATPAPAPAAEPRASFWEMLLNFGRSPQALRLAMAVLLIAFVLFGSGRAVLAAEKALPGDTLYPVKITQESIQVLISLSEIKDAQLHTQFAQRRLLEIQELVLESRFEYVEDTVEAYERQVDRAIVALRQVAGQDPVQAEQIATELEQVLTQQTTVLAILSESAPEDTQAHLQRAMDVSQAGVITVNEIRLTAIAQTTATPTPTPIATAAFTQTPSGTATGLVIAAATQTASPSPSVTISATLSISGTLVVSGTPASVAEGTSTPAPTNTRIPGTGPTATATTKAQPTATRTPTPTDEGPPAATATFTATQPPPTHTPTATQPGVTPPTSTTQPSPTWTPSPTPVTPSSTPVPPSPTPTTPPPPPPTDIPAPVCIAEASIDSPIGNKIDIRIQNQGEIPMTLSRVTIDWPLTNEELREAEMSGSTIWSGNENTSPTTIGNWSGSPEARTVAPGAFKNLRFTFKRAAESSGYNVALNFEQSCSTTARR